MKNKVILLIVGLAMVALLAVATLFYEDLSAQFGADPITPTQRAPQEDQNTASGEQEKQPVAAPDFTVEDANSNAVSLSAILLFNFHSLVSLASSFFIHLLPAVYKPCPASIAIFAMLSPYPFNCLYA